MGLTPGVPVRCPAYPQQVTQLPRDQRGPWPGAQPLRSGAAGGTLLPVGVTEGSCPCPWRTADNGRENWLRGDAGSKAWPTAVSINNDDS